MKDHLKPLKNGEKLGVGSMLSVIIKMSIPAILAQISSIIMQYIDAAMVGRLGTSAAAAIGLVSTTTWLIGGVINALAIGFNVQIAHKTGAGDCRGARSLVRHGLLTVTAVSLAVSAICLSVGRFLPAWLGGDPSIRRDAFLYFAVYAASIPIMGADYSAVGMLQCSGNMKIPGALNIMKCVLDVIFNFFFIFPSRGYTLLGREITVPGLGLGVLGAALGTAASLTVCAAFMLWFLLVRSESLSLRREKPSGVYSDELRRAIKIAIPVGIESAAMGLAYVVSTKIVAPLGTVSITAHSFSITVESLCYMPGYGIGVAMTAIIGQVMGAGQFKAAKKLSWLSVFFGMAVMTASGAVMYILAPQMIGLLSSDPEVTALGTLILRIEAFAEPLYAASIAVSGVFRGVGDTLGPSLINLLSMWVFRIPLSAFLSHSMGLKGVWIAMAVELSIRGLALLIRLAVKTYGKEMTLNDRKSGADSY